jgi:proline iminopeptidase
MKNKDKFTRKSGMLDVGDDHKIYWEDWGNPQAPPIMHFHGGPGGGFDDSHKLAFNPEKHRVIFYDQRGSGKSTPYASTKNNTTQDLVEDAEKLRNHLNLGKIYLIGGSWGSTMSLMYALTYPDNVKGIVMWGIYLARQFENDIISAGYSRYTYPEAWERYISMVPEEHRKDGTSITRYYAGKINSEDEAEAIKYADEWTLWECSLLTLDYDKRKIENGVILGDDSNLAIARFETYYFLNGCFIPENHILDNIEKIKHIPTYVVQGRFDNCTPPVSAYELSKAYGDNLTLQFVNAGHKRHDAQLKASLVTAINTVFK